MRIEFQKCVVVLIDRVLRVNRREPQWLLVPYEAQLNLQPVQQILMRAMFKTLYTDPRKSTSAYCNRPQQSNCPKAKHAHNNTRHFGAQD
eukprot:4695978-Amphidinium_carterae.1